MPRRPSESPQVPPTLLPESYSGSPPIRLVSSHSVAVQIVNTSYDFALSPFTLGSSRTGRFSHSPNDRDLRASRAFPPPFWRDSRGHGGVAGGSSGDVEVSYGSVGSARDGPAARGCEFGAPPETTTIIESLVPPYPPSRKPLSQIASSYPLPPYASSALLYLV
ncbi:hypothetical protein C8F01DRAFT_1258311 [Mycena amicta]|nr:hypothetical protein C8F01DRAFT_1258311 [Mycena amicta]